MDRCQNHRREIVGSCMWCGKRMCQQCVVRSEGKKLYCEKCATNLKPVQRQKLPSPPATGRIASPFEQPEKPSKQKYVLDADGYLAPQ